MFIGIDPGIHGGIAVIYEGLETYNAYPLPIMSHKVGKKTRNKLNVEGFIGLLRDIINGCNGLEEINIAIEHVTAMPGNGVTSMFNFGYTFGILLGVGHTFTRKISTIPPRTWKNLVLKDYPHDKQGSISFVQAFYPKLNLILPRKKIPHDGMADSMCISHYLKLTSPHT